MKYIRKKIIRGIPYYYFEYGLKPETGKITYSRYLGKYLPEDLKGHMENFFSEIARISYKDLNCDIKDYFPPNGAKKVEYYRYRYACLNHELFDGEFRLFRNLFNILFVLNSN
ncbi:MAG: hypothetical protein V3R93_05240, partial [Candidatus Hydrothermarchaeaceae archaeon]